MPEHPVHLATWNAICISVCLSITTITLVLRSYVRIHIKGQWILEDSMCLLAWVGLVVYCALIAVTVSKHAGAHEKDLSLLESQQAIHSINITSIVYNPVVLSTKVAILLFYRRIFSPIHRSAFDLLLRLFIAVLVCFYVATFIVKIWECNPRARIWDKSVPGTCLNSSGVLNTSGIFNLVTDCLILLVPPKAVWNMHLTPKRKLGVIGVFTLGLSAPIFSIIGTVVRLRVSSNPDVTYYQPIIQLWAAAEVTTGIICVCVPTLAALARHDSLAPRKPSTSIINGTLSRRPTRKSGSLDEEGLFDISRQDIHSTTGAGTIAMNSVVTGIEGGATSVQDEKRDGKEGGGGMARSEDGGDEVVANGTGIMTTVRIEQSYV